MRLWSLHPRHLDRAALVAQWREGLLAQAVVAGRTKGYRHHPQLNRFRGVPDPLGAVVTYLDAIAAEADARGYRFDRTRLDGVHRVAAPILVTEGQLAYEHQHLLAKVAARNPDELPRLAGDIAAHPLLLVVPGPMEDWERPSA